MEPCVSPWYVDVGVVNGGSGSSSYIDSTSLCVNGVNSCATINISAPFFADMLTAFEIWLDFGGGASADGRQVNDSLGQSSHFPLYLPIILQVTSYSH